MTITGIIIEYICGTLVRMMSFNVDLSMCFGLRRVGDCTSCVRCHASASPGSGVTGQLTHCADYTESDSRAAAPAAEEGGRQISTIRQI